MKKFHPFIYLSIYLFIYSPVHAQSLSLSLSPPLMEITIQPGRSVTFSYQITNNSEKELTITPSLKKMLPYGADGLISFQTMDKNIPFSLTFDSGEKFGSPFLLPVGQTKQLVVKLSVNPNALEKDYYQTLFLSTAGSALSGSNQTGSITQIGSNILISVSQSGAPAVSGVVDSLTAPTIIDSLAFLDINLWLKNTGNSLFKPFGKVQIRGWFNQAKELPILEQNILANSTRRFSIDKYRPDLPLGVFTIKAQFQPNGMPPFSEKSIVVYYIPYKLFGSILIAVLVSKVCRRIRKNNQARGR